MGIAWSGSDGSSRVYLGGLYLLGGERWNDIHKITLNELGDFLAGAFAPLAFLWLVLGIYQQRNELRLSTEELANTAKQTEALSRTASDELEHQRLQQRAVNDPIIVVNQYYSREGESITLKLGISNHGAIVTNVIARIADKESVLVSGRSVFLDKETELRLEYTFDREYGRMSANYP